MTLGRGRLEGLSQSDLQTRIEQSGEETAPSGQESGEETAPFDREAASIALMDAYLRERGLENDLSPARLHHEIYLSDARRVPPEKWRTVIRHPVRPAAHP